MYAEVIQRLESQDTNKVTINPGARCDILGPLPDGKLQIIVSCMGKDVLAAAPVECIAVFDSPPEIVRL